MGGLGGRGGRGVVEDGRTGARGGWGNVVDGEGRIRIKIQILIDDMYFYNFFLAV